MNCGDAVVSPSPGSLEEHLWVAITTPDASGKFVLVNVTSQGPEKEQTCVLNAGDHPFIKHESVIRYVDATIVDLTLVREAIAGKIMRPNAPMSAAVLRRIQSGAIVSKFAENGVKTAVRTELGSS